MGILSLVCKKKLLIRAGDTDKAKIVTNKKFTEILKKLLKL